MEPKGHSPELDLIICDEDTREQIEAIRKQVLHDPRYSWEDVPSLGDSPSFKVLARERCTASQPSVVGTSALLSRLEVDSIPQYVWPASHPMCAWILSHPDVFDGKTVLELGCGTGVVGLTAARYAKRVVLSDASPVSLALSVESVLCNGFHHCSVAELKWGNRGHLTRILENFDATSFDIVIGSDVFYFHSSLKSGLATARDALSPNGELGGIFLCGSSVRSERMECDLDEMPMREGFSILDSVLADPFRLFFWQVSRQPLVTVDSPALDGCVQQL